jgi:hypothetical protein
MEGVARKQPDFGVPVHRCREFLTAAEWQIPQKKAGHLLAA